MKAHFTYSDLLDYLNLKRGNKLSADEMVKVKDHLDNCMACWFTWNKVRWDQAFSSEGIKELRDYLGDKFIPYYDSSWALAARWNQENPSTPSEVETFYESAEEYLYNLVVWHESGDREDFQPELLNLIKKYRVRSVIDYGCGVGTDGLFLLKKEITVKFVDFDCPSIDFLKWRLRQRSLTASYYDVKKIEKLPKADMFWAIDVLEHMVDPLEVVAKLDESTSLFVHRSQFNDKAGGRHPCHFNFNEIRLSRALSRKGFIHMPWNKLSLWVKNPELFDKIQAEKIGVQ